MKMTPAMVPMRMYLKLTLDLAAVEVGVVVTGIRLVVGAPVVVAGAAEVGAEVVVGATVAAAGAAT